MNKAHTNISWENYPSEKTPLNEENLNKMDISIEEIDNRVIALDTTKATKTEVATMIADVSFDETTGIFTFTRKNGATFTLDTKLEKIAVNFSYNHLTQKLVIALIDGTIQEIDLSSLISQYEFIDSDTVAFTVDNTGKVTAILKEGSIQEKHLRPDYLSDIKVESAKAESSAEAAKTSEDNAKSYAEDAEAWAVGKRGGANVPSTDETYENNAKYWAEQAKGTSGDVVTSFNTRKGNVTLNDSDVTDALGYTPLATNGDSKDNKVTFTSSDVADASATAWTSVPKLTSGATHSSIFAKVSQMFKNIRYLYNNKIDLSKILTTVEACTASTDPNSIPNAAVISELNSGLTLKEITTISLQNSTGGVASGYRIAKRLICVIGETTPTSISHGLVIMKGLPAPWTTIYFSLSEIDGNNLPCMLDMSGNVYIYYPIAHSPSRIDFCFCYPSYS